MTNVWARAILSVILKETSWAEHGYLDIVEYLLLHTANVTSNVLDRAVRSCLDVDILERIISHINQNLPKDETKQPVDVGQALGSSLVRAVRFHKSHDLIASLIHLGADINFRNESGKSALCIAARWEVVLTGNPIPESDPDNSGRLSILLQNGADPNIRGGDFGTPLIAAVVRGIETKLLLLLQAGADVNVQIESVGTALTAAAACSWRSP